MGLTIGLEEMVESTRKGAGRLVTLARGAGLGFFYASC